MERALPYLLYFTAFLGVIIRMDIFLQARNLFIDEANIARNLYERGFLALLKPLDYEQFAPPLFLWVSKLNSIIFGFSEISLRLFPFICGLFSIFLLIYLVKLLIGKNYAIYPLALFAGGYIFLHYGTELKQYSSDFMVTLILLVASVKSKENFNSLRFVLFWILLGTIAIWLSMPSVFMLFAISIYWLSKTLKEKQLSSVLSTACVSGFWFLQFALYFFFILKDQISSEYLQGYHTKSFLYFSWTSASVVNNAKLLSSLINQSSGFTTIALVTNSILLIVGGIALYKKEKLRSLIFFLPILALLFAALIQKYALADRLVLFIHPILFVLLAFGVKTLYDLKNRRFRVFLLVVLGLNVINHQNFKYVFEKLEIQEIHYALDVIENAQYEKQYETIWVHNGAVPAFIFYTEMSPKRKQYDVLREQSQLLNWDADYKNKYAELETGERVWILLTNYFPEDKAVILKAMHKAELVKMIDKPGGLLFHYEKL
jgi:uncharacterized membrane protein